MEQEPPSDVSPWAVLALDNTVRTFAAIGIHLPLLQDLHARALADFKRTSQLCGLDSLTVPVLRHDHTGEFKSLAGPVVTVGRLSGQSIGWVRQRVRLELDRTGVQLDSEAAGGLFGGGREFDFNRPFLVLLMRKGAPRPYLAAWIGNKEFMRVLPHEPASAAPGMGG